MPRFSFLDSIASMSPGKKLLLGIVGFVVVGFGYFYFLVSPAQGRVADLDLRRQAVERDLTQARAALADLARFRRETAEMERRLETIKEKLPSEREIPPLFRTMYDAASRSGLAVSLFQPKEPRILDYYTEIPIAVSAEGTYHQLGKFFESVAGFPRVVTIGDLKLTGLNRPSNPVRAEMTLATYVYRPVGSPPPPKPGAPRPAAAPVPGPRTDVDPKTSGPAAPGVKG